MKSVDIVGKKLTGDDIIPYLVEVELIAPQHSKTDEDVTTQAFRRVRETLERIGVSSRRHKNTLYQSCHILHKRGKYYIVHFKTMYVLDGRDNNLTVDDIARQNKIIHLLQGWNMIKVVDPNMVDEPVMGLEDTKILRHSERKDWICLPKYALGTNLR